MILNFNAPINTTSYGYVSSYILKELLSLNYDVRYIPIINSQLPSPDELLLPHIKKALDRWDFSYKAPCLKIWHQYDLNSFYGKGIRIGMPIFELEKFNARELHSLNNPDQLFVCSEWAKTVIHENIPDKVNNTHVVPLGYNQDIFKPCPLPSNDKTIFGNFGKFEIRKGHDVLPEIFNAAFEKDDDVLLVMMASNPFLTSEETKSWIDSFKNTKLGDKIVFVGRQQTQDMVYNIMSQIHCGIFPSRAEGWNLEALELLACGRHVIITHCTAHTEFCNMQNSKLVHMQSGYEKAMDNKWFHGEFEWRKIGASEKDQMIQYMRDIHQKRKDGNLYENLEGVKSAQKFTWKNTASIIDSKIKQMSEN